MLAIGLLLFYACTSELEPVLDDETLSIELAWTPGLLLTDKRDMETGLAWVLSLLGAELPSGSLNRATSPVSDHDFTINFNKLGFTDDALRAIHRVLQRLKMSEEYQQKGNIALGRLVMLMLNSSYHYYEITDVPETISEFRSLYNFNGQQLTVTNSAITSVHRLLEVANAAGYAQIAHIGGESGQEFRAGRAFKPTEFETLDVLPNGQLRFAVYGANGRLKPFADDALTLAGRPAKCMWCHESGIQPFFSIEPVQSTDSTLTEEEFLEIRETQTNWIHTYRMRLDTDLDFSNRSDHQFAEWIYEDFMEPTAQEVAHEWGISLEATMARLQGVETYFRHGTPDFYRRKVIDMLGPYKVELVPEAAREKSAFEPNFF